MTHPCHRTGMDTLISLSNCLFSGMDFASLVSEMRSRTSIAVLLTLAHSASAIDTPPNPRISQDDLYEELPLNLTDGPGDPTCSGRMYGGNLKPASCKNAWDKIERSSVPKRSAVRSAPDRESFDYLLPKRYLSDDGLCAIDVSIPQSQIAAGRRWDLATGLQLSNSAWEVLEYCVTYGQGGVVGSFSTRNALTITIRDYEPSVDCEPRAPQVPDYHSCELALQALPASRFVRAFVNSDYREPGRGVTKLPKEYADTSGRYAGVCHIIISMSPSSTATTMTYRDVWESAVAINTMCIQYGLLGTVRDLGNDLKIQVSILPDFRSPGG